MSSQFKEEHAADIRKRHEVMKPISESSGVLRVYGDLDERLEHLGRNKKTDTLVSKEDISLAGLYLMEQARFAADAALNPDGIETGAFQESFDHFWRKLVGRDIARIDDRYYQYVVDADVVSSIGAFCCELSEVLGDVSHVDPETMAATLISEVFLHLSHKGRRHTQEKGTQLALPANRRFIFVTLYEGNSFKKVRIPVSKLTSISKLTKHLREDDGEWQELDTKVVSQMKQTRSAVRPLKMARQNLEDLSDPYTADVAVILDHQNSSQGGISHLQRDLRTDPNGQSVFYQIRVGSDGSLFCKQPHPFSDGSEAMDELEAISSKVHKHLSGYASSEAKGKRPSQTSHASNERRAFLDEEHEPQTGELTFDVKKINEIFEHTKKKGTPITLHFLLQAAFMISYGVDNSHFIEKDKKNSSLVGVISVLNKAVHEFFSTGDDSQKAEAIRLIAEANELFYPQRKLVQDPTFPKEVDICRYMATLTGRFSSTVRSTASFLDPDKNDLITNCPLVISGPVEADRSKVNKKNRSFSGTFLSVYRKDSVGLIDVDVNKVRYVRRTRKSVDRKEVSQEDVQDVLNRLIDLFHEQIAA
jgi:hypothetical protein